MEMSFQADLQKELQNPRFQAPKLHPLVQHIYSKLNQLDEFLSDTQSDIEIQVFKISVLTGYQEGSGRGDDGMVVCVEEGELRSLEPVVHELRDMLRAIHTRWEYVKNEREIQTLKAELDSLRAPDQDSRLKIRKLRAYNDIKDVGQELMGLVAENRGVTISTLYESGEFGVGPSD